MTSLQTDNVVEPIAPSSDLGKIERLRRISEVSRDESDKKMADEAQWRETSLVVQHTSEEEGDTSANLKKLSQEALYILKVAACLETLNVRILEAATGRANVEHHLATATAAGVLVSGESPTGPFSFASPETLVAVYKLIPVNDENVWNATIARNLATHFTQDELHENYYMVLNQFHRVPAQFTTRQERYFVANMCLKASEASVMAGNFHAACNYVDFAIHELLPPNHWNDEYNLSLALYSTAIEVLYCTGDYEKMDDMVTIVLKQARTFPDSMRARATRTYSLGSRYQMAQALKEGLQVLRQLGETFPKNPTRFHVLLEYFKTKLMLRNKTNEMILRRTLMHNPDKLAAVQMLNVMYANAFKTSPLLFVLLLLRMVQLTRRFGIVNGVSSVGFAYYGLFCFTFSKNKDEGDRYGQLALALLEKFPSREWIPRIYVAVYGEASSYRQHIRESYEPPKHASSVGLATGDIERAMLAANLYLGYMIFSGDSLARIEEEATGFLKVAMERKQDNALRIMRPTLQLAYSLTGNSSTSINLDSDLARAKEAKDVAAICIIYFSFLLPAYVFHDYETAAAQAEGIKPFLVPPFVHPGLSCFPTFYALSLLAVMDTFRGRRRTKAMTTVRDIFKLMTRFSMYSPENCLGKTHFLQAEVAVVDGNERLAWIHYVGAISMAQEFDDVMMRAIVCERAARFLQHQGKRAMSIKYLNESYLAYQKWGATTKVEQMKQDMPDEIAAGST